MGREIKEPRSDYNRKNCSWHLKSKLTAMWWGEALKMPLIGFCLKNFALKCDCSPQMERWFSCLLAHLIEEPSACFCLASEYWLLDPEMQQKAGSGCRGNGMWLKLLQWELWVVKTGVCQWNNQMCLEVSRGRDVSWERVWGFVLFFSVGFWFGLVLLLLLFFFFLIFLMLLFGF